MFGPNPKSTTKSEKRDRDSQRENRSESIQIKRKEKKMKITVMTADEQIITLDVDPHESVTLQNLVFGHTFIHECMCAYTYVYVCANTHKLINCYFSFSFFLNFYIWVCRNRLKTWRLCLKWRWDLFDMLFLYWVLCCAWLIRKYGEGNRLRFWIINAICKNLKLYYTDVCVCVCVCLIFLIV